MIEQYLLNTNENATVTILQKFRTVAIQFVFNNYYSLRPQILLFLADFRQISVTNKRPFYPQLIWVPPFNHAR